MTSAHKPVFLVVSNNQDIVQLVKEILLSSNVTVKTSLPSEIDKLKLDKIHYLIFFLQRNLLDQDTTTSLINLYDLAKNHQSKIAIVDIHKNQIQEDEVERTFQLLNQVSAGSPRFRYILTKDLFQDKDNRNTFSLEQDMQLVATTKKIKISSKGENLIYPLNLKDLIAAVLKSLFLERMAGQKLTIIGDPIKDLELSYIIKDELEKTDSTLNIDTTAKDIIPLASTLNASAESRALLKWLPSDTNEESLKRKIFKLVNRPSADIKPALSLQKPIPPALHKTEKKFLISIPVILISISVTAFLIISLIYVLLLSTSLKKTKNSFDYLNKGNTEEVSKDIQSASKYLQAGEDVSRYILPVYKVISPELIININNFSSLLKHSQLTIQSINESYQLANNLYHDLFTPSGISTSLDISTAIQSRLRTIHQELSQIEIISQNHTLPSFFSQKLKDIDFAKKINILRNQTAQSLKLLEAFSGILANSKTQYLALLVQDSNELKSTGGTIRALVLANVENQKIINIRILSPGQIDQQMVGSIPSTPIIEILTGQPNLSFTNSNISPNFIATSLMVEKFLKNSVNFTPDLIIGLTTQTLEDLNKETGSTQQLHQELANSAINHTASQITVSLLEKIVANLQTQTTPLINLVRPVISTLNQDNLRVWFKDPAKEGSIINYSLAGNVFKNNCHPLLNQNGCFSDIAFLAESNLSVAPFNYYQERQLQHQVTIQDQSVMHSFILNYKYESVPNQINRDYQALYQIYLHSNAQFVSLEKNNQEIDITVEKETQGDLSLFQIPLSHKPEGSVSVKINFIVKGITSPINTQNFAYSLKTYHQPGTSIQNNQIIINHPL
ncbi:DUF4012 domain-containing protein, partial [Patescibacteria group bacterium]|nr:DUF4012 domain-containing protein [Patescibacteria group bacterium]